MGRLQLRLDAIAVLASSDRHWVQAENDGLKQQLQAEQTRVEDAQAEMQRRCSSFECQLQSACSECTAAAEEHVTGSLRGMEKRLDRLQVLHPHILKMAALCVPPC